jgi:hypothetical protein
MIINYMKELINGFILIQMEILQHVHSRVHFEKQLSCLLFFCFFFFGMSTQAGKGREI